MADKHCPAIVHHYCVQLVRMPYLPSVINKNAIVSERISFVALRFNTQTFLSSLTIKLRSLEFLKATGFIYYTALCMRSNRFNLLTRMFGVWSMVIAASQILFLHRLVHKIHTMPKGM